MQIEYFHASRFGNGALVAKEFKRQVAADGVVVNVHHVREVAPKDVQAADLYVFSSPGRMGKPTRRVRRFLEQLAVPPNSRYALLTTELAPKPDKKSGLVPTEEELAKWQRVRPIINEMLERKGLVRIAEEKVYVTGLRGPLEEGWQGKVAGFVSQLPIVGTGT